MQQCLSLALSLSPFPSDFRSLYFFSGVVFSVNFFVRNFCIASISVLLSLSLSLCLRFVLLHATLLLFSYTLCTLFTNPQNVFYIQSRSLQLVRFRLDFVRVWRCVLGLCAATNKTRCVRYPPKQSLYQ